MNERSSFRPHSLFVLSAMCMAAPGFAQNHLLVPSQFAEIGLAVQAANPGDIIEVAERVPHYQPFVIDRPVTIVGSPAGSFKAPTVVLHQGIGIDIQLAPGERVTLSRIDVRVALGAVPSNVMRVHGGAVALEDCRFSGGINTGPSRADSYARNTAAVEAVGTELTALFCRFGASSGGTALRATNSIVAITDSRCFGGPSSGATGLVPCPPGDGVHLHDSSLHANEALLFGGDEFHGLTGLGGSGLLMTGNSMATVRNGRLRGGMGPVGGSGLVNNTTIPVESSGTVFLGGMQFGPPFGGSAPATTGALITNPDLIGLSWSQGYGRAGTLRLGHTWHVHSTAASHNIAVLALAFDPSGFAPLITRQPALLPQDIALLVLGTSVGFPPLPNNPSLRGTVLWGQAVAGSNLPLEASPPSAVVVR